jgi:hypothetical protein
MATGVKESTGGFEYTEVERGITATRVFTYDPDSTVDEGVEIPNLGDMFEFPIDPPNLDSYAFDLMYLICVSRSIKPLAGHPGKFEWSCSYTNEPVDTMVFWSVGDIPDPVDVQYLPKTIEFGGEYVNINPVNAPGSAGWLWSSDDTTVVQPLPTKVNKTTLKITRYIPDERFTTFEGNVKTLTGSVNNSADPFGTVIGGGMECWLFEGATTEIFYNCFNHKMWRAELQFSYRNPDHASGAAEVEGWNKILRLDGQWDVPYRSGVVPPDNDVLYEDGDFSALFDDSVIAV